MGFYIVCFLYGYYSVPPTCNIFNALRTAINRQIEAFFQKSNLYTISFWW